MGGSGDQGWCASLCTADKLWARGSHAVGFGAGTYVRWRGWAGVRRRGAQSQVVSEEEASSEISCVQR